MICPYCGQTIMTGDKFCVRCGRPIAVNMQATRNMQAAPYTQAAPNMQTAPNMQRTAPVSGKTVNVKITRKDQWFLVNPPIRILIDNKWNCQVENAESIIVSSLEPGVHTFHFSITCRTRDIVLDVQQDREIYLEMNRVYGSIDAYVN